MAPGRSDFFESRVRTEGLPADPRDTKVRQNAVVSDNWMIIIPIDPSAVPSADRAMATWHLLVTFVPEAAARWEVSEHPVFVDAGANWEGVKCKSCGTPLDDWWRLAVSDAYDQSLFDDLSVRTPCCGCTTSLNDLDYRWPVGFARAQLIIDGHHEIPSGVIHSIEDVLGCSTRTIIRHV
jgi:hypothetical protein